MKSYFIILALFVNTICVAKSERPKGTCPVPDCPDSEVVCAYDVRGVTYKMFPSRCAMDAYVKCYELELAPASVEFCWKHHNKEMLPSRVRRMYGESCPVFCPTHYSPVCGAAKYRDYMYRSFINGCYLDMLNCRAEDEFNGYVEVPLQFCQNHAMRNIFKEQIIMSNVQRLRDYE